MKLNKKQKRTATIASMAALLAVVLGMGGQTFAKYYETNTAASTNATVAAWGVVIRNSIDSTEVTGVDKAPVFKADYDNNDVKSSDSRKVVAPGTSGGVTVEITGKPEVAVLVETTFTIVSDVKLQPTSGTAYYPIKWTVKCGDATVQSFKGATAQADVQAAVNTYVGTTAKAPSTPGLSYIFTIGWTWDFEGQDNDLDTICGNIAAGQTVDGYTLQDSIEYSVVTDVTQVDTL